MTTLPDSTRVRTKRQCPECYKGRIPHDKPNTIFDASYCPSCDGTGWIEYWASLYELTRALNRIDSMEQAGK